jgi:hypothetical protein
MVLARAARPYTVLRLHPFNIKRERVVSPADWDEVPTFLKLKKVLKRREGQIFWVLEALLLSRFSFKGFQMQTLVRLKD